MLMNIAAKTIYVRWQRKFTAYCTPLAILVGKTKCGKLEVTSDLLEIEQH